MSESLKPLIIDLLEWLEREPREYQEVMDAWRTACPRLTVWEDAMDEGLIVREGRMVIVTTKGHDYMGEPSDQTGRFFQTVPKSQSGTIRSPR